MRRAAPAFVISAALVLSITASLILEPYRALFFIILGAVLSEISFLVYYYKLEFLSMASTHSSLLAVALGLIAESSLGVNAYLTAMALGVLLVIITGTLIDTGKMDPDKATGLITGLTASASVVVTYYALVNIPLKFSLSAIMLGDPLLASRADLLLLAALFVINTAIIAGFYSSLMELSIDDKSLAAMGKRGWAYKYAVYGLIGMTTVGLLRSAGYIAEHVLILLPALSFAPVSSSSKEHAVLTVLGGIAASLGSYLISVYANLPPSGAMGIILLIAYIVSRLAG